jgi:hypothetical protein
LKRLLLEAFMESNAVHLEEGTLTAKESATAASLALRHNSTAWVWEGIENGNKR